MATPYHHALSSVKKWGGTVETYLPVHEWFDASKELHGDFRHRALRHHTQGVFECERVFGTTLALPDGRRVPVRWVAEQHVVEDLGWLPGLSDWLRHLRPQPWMNRPRRLSRELDAAAGPPASYNNDDQPPPAKESA